MTARIVVEIPDKALFAISDAAEMAGQTVTEFLLSTGMRMAGIRGAALDSVQRLHALGFSDSEIGRRLDMTNRAVTEQRRRLNLPPNRLIRGARKDIAA